MAKPLREVFELARAREFVEDLRERREERARALSRHAYALDALWLLNDTNKPEFVSRVRLEMSGPLSSWRSDRHAIFVRSTNRRLRLILPRAGPAVLYKPSGEKATDDFLLSGAAAPYPALCDDVVGTIFAFLPLDVVRANCRFVCKQWHRVSKGDQVWRQVLSPDEWRTPPPPLHRWIPVLAPRLVPEFLRRQPRFETGSRDVLLRAFYFLCSVFSADKSSHFDVRDTLGKPYPNLEMSSPILFQLHRHDKRITIFAKQSALTWGPRRIRTWDTCQFRYYSSVTRDARHLTWTYAKRIYFSRDSGTGNLWPDGATSFWEKRRERKRKREEEPAGAPAPTPIDWVGFLL